MYAIKVHTNESIVSSTKVFCAQLFIQRYHISMIYEFSMDTSGTPWTF
jgi:hypothetical protein